MCFIFQAAFTKVATNTSSLQKYVFKGGLVFLSTFRNISQRVQPAVHMLCSNITTNEEATNTSRKSKEEARVLLLCHLILLSRIVNQGGGLYQLFGQMFNSSSITYGSSLIHPYFQILCHFNYAISLISITLQLVHTLATNI